MIEFSEIIKSLIENWGIVLLFFSIAILYSSVGFGGGSSYLAILALTGLAFTQIRATALLCNIVVVTSGTLIYAKHGLYNWRKVIPLVSFSIPLAFIGGYLKISQSFFFILLGITLIIAALFMWMSKYVSEKSSGEFYQSSLTKDASYGGIIGFISGMVGIGGGIFLAPLLHLTNWDTPKKIAATASLFILVNSIAGLLGQMQHNKFTIEWDLTLVLLISVFIGGQIGSRLSAKTISPFLLKKITAVLIAIVGLRILWKYVI
ncbi:sulfite exporter TauE/SafE family protein [Urechidicola vernalis]|uniref:Probable membrane transporter protein n=1 Tax=Urechidicola vernalis TaxID=3075600 RepID=A0ABU2Y7V5_9FLAO|nr:sulfite exporter TauE/SafE family protein [Urechidicola sp. P050]MDT0553787.1 sulfite exporter TauE/SafE family protein [Urechidicola sp. P050]